MQQQEFALCCHNLFDLSMGFGQVL